MDWVGLGWVGMSQALWVGFVSVGLGCGFGKVGFVCVVLRWVGLSWVGLLGWVRLVWVEVGFGSVREWSVWGTESPFLERTFSSSHEPFSSTFEPSLCESRVALQKVRPRT